MICSNTMSGPAVTPSGRYRVLHRLASGGMGEVELAVREEAGFRRIFAIKRLPAALREDHSARSMFLDEARLAGLVRHPNVVSVLDVGEDERGPFLVMEFVEGISAAALLRWAGKNGVSLPVQLCLRLARELALGLHAAHELTDHEGRPLNLVHRDISPQNLLIGFDGIAYVADFGIAKAAGRSTRTTTGLLKGKAGYMSPEQLRFEEVDRRSDLFSLAVVLYELLAARRLYRSENDIATARRILHEPPPDIDDVRGDVPPAVVELLFSALAKDPTARPESAAEVARRMDAAIAAMVAEEGVVDVAEYIRTHFAARRAELQELIARARKGEPLVDVDVDLAPLKADARPWRRRSLGIAAAVAIVVTATLSVAAWQVSGADLPSSAPGTVAAPVAASEPRVLPPEPEPEPAREAPAEVIATPTTDVPAADGPEEARVRAPRRGSRRARTEPSAQDDGLFGWQ
jgi:hypothetical protein